MERGLRGGVEFHTDRSRVKLTERGSSDFFTLVKILMNAKANPSRELHRIGIIFQSTSLSPPGRFIEAKRSPSFPTNEWTVFQHPPTMLDLTCGIQSQFRCSEHHRAQSSVQALRDLLRGFSLLVQASQLRLLPLRPGRKSPPRIRRFSV